MSLTRAAREELQNLVRVNLQQLLASPKFIQDFTNTVTDFLAYKVTALETHIQTLGEKIFCWKIKFKTLKRK